MLLVLRRTLARVLLLLLFSTPTLANVATAHRRLERLERHVSFLHARMAELLCEGKSVDATSASGAWCLTPDTTLFGHPMAPLHFLDSGVAPSVYDLVRNRTVLDVGAGSGQYGRYLLSRGFPAEHYSAIDGALNVEPFTSDFVRWADLTLPYERDEGPADWVLSLEVGEHIPASFEKTYIGTLHRNNRCGLILSWAVPGQGGKGHINCLTNEEVQERFGALGYTFDAAFAEGVRAKAELSWFKNTFMLFRRSPAPPECTA